MREQSENERDTAEFRKPEQRGDGNLDEGRGLNGEFQQINDGGRQVPVVGGRDEPLWCDFKEAGVEFLDAAPEINSGDDESVRSRVFGFQEIQSWHG